MIENIYKKLLIIRRKSQYKKRQYNYRIFLNDAKKYSYTDDFLNWSETKEYTAEDFLFDENGIPLVNYAGRWYLNPCTALQYTLKVYGDYIKEKTDYSSLKKDVEFCLGLMDEENKITYPFDYPYYCDPDNYFSAGWTSCMDYGHMLSICARMSVLAPNEIDKYNEIADRCMQSLLVPIAEGGVFGTLGSLDSRYKKYIIFEEYPHIPETYTLNGFEYCLLGLYDWACAGANSSGTAKKLFYDGIETLKILLPFFDVGGFTCYDLAHLTIGARKGKPYINAGYHREHIYFNKLFYDITGDDIFIEYYNKWKGYVD